MVKIPFSFGFFLYKTKYNSYIYYKFYINKYITSLTAIRDGLNNYILDIYGMDDKSNI